MESLTNIPKGKTLQTIKNTKSRKVVEPDKLHIYRNYNYWNQAIY